MHFKNPVFLCLWLMIMPCQAVCADKLTLPWEVMESFEPLIWRGDAGFIKRDIIGVILPLSP